MPRPARCHPDQPHYAKGRCRPCWHAQRRRELAAARQARKRPCELCGRRFGPVRSDQRFCSSTCNAVSGRHRRRKTAHREVLTAYLDREIALREARQWAKRGCKPVSTSCPPRLAPPAWVQGWRAGDLFLVRYSALDLLAA